VTDPLEAMLERVNRVPGVRGALLVSLEDGLLVSAALMEGIDGDAVAALSASLANRLVVALAAAGRAAPTLFHLEAGHGSLLAAMMPGDLLLISVLEPGANLGLARLELLAAMELAV